MSSKDRASGRPTIAPDALELYRDSGWQVIPLHRWNEKSSDKHGLERQDAKRPLDSNWTTRAYDDAAVIERCVREGRNMGVRLTAEQLVVDLDPRNGGVEGFRKLCRKFGLEPRLWPRVETGSGGSHYYLRLPNGVRVLDTLEGFSGCEFKSVGRQVVAAGSVHPNGKPYFWDEIDHPCLADAPEAPAALVEAIRRPERTGEAVKGGQYSRERIAHALSKLDVTDFRDHEKWLRLLMACHHASNGDARSEFIAWSTDDPEYADDAEIIGRRWDSLHSEKNDGITYRTLNKILADAGQASAQAPGDASEDFDAIEGEGAPELGDNGLQYRVAADIEPEPIEWLWPNRFAVGKLGIVAGFPDAGKSQITCNMAAIVTKGGKWPDTKTRTGKGAVIILSAEDDAADTVRPRLEAAGADLNQALIVNSIVRTEESTRVLNLSDDLGRLADVIKTERTKGRNVKLVIIDPISAYMGGKAKGDTFKNSEVRAMLTPLVEWAARYRVAVVAISHFNKAGNSRALYRVTDSLAFTAAARTVWMTADEENTQRKLFLKGKCNIAEDPGGLAYVIECVRISNGIEAPRVRWDGPVDVTADEALGGNGQKSTAVDRAESWLEQFLMDGPKARTEVEDHAADSGHSLRTIERAKKNLGVLSYKEEFGSGWLWRLPD